ncbi:precorrin-2 dehydrogenase [Bacillus paranthracis]|uniref:precorrin-2 dehydrogenase n=1 Tax=Bacillus paranthracis TaxID=2026186 RepID=UPI000200F14C|nr:precorrin-2 dehydrogenase [Bacillus paranthracis]ADY21455.1 precorrin-2 dehydrogenase [Bacillus thuringiensis serovar finitimus YBT-020]MRC69943.1 precorrin-2 dehydrogenase [Bacillus thuringiensis]OTX63195.1 precorrin-2 dehydrogenase [Bacillus thuringiensis serovar finitimus]MCR6798305.1 precorrin-2 dehydrogenase [Bacillus paranthracis]MEC3356742.1 precorrin-2 dehydrogenase [Bacillus paranthracis]
MYNMYPLMLNLNKKVVVIIGGGKIAYRKASGLKDTGAFVTVISPEICAEMKELPYITWKQKTFSNDDIKDAHLIYAATNQHAVNLMVKQAAHNFQWVNVVSDGTESSFHTPGVIRDNEYVVTISTSGKDPSFTKRLKQELTSIFPKLIKKLSLTHKL